MPKSNGQTRADLTREDQITASLLIIAAHVVQLKQQLSDDDYKRLTNLRPLIDASDRLVSELGYDDDNNQVGVS